MVELQMLSTDQCKLIEDKLQAHLKSYVDDFQSALAGLQINPSMDSVNIADPSELTHTPLKKHEPPIAPDFFDVKVVKDYDPTEPNEPTINLIQKSKANSQDPAVPSGTGLSESIPISGSHEQTLKPKLRSDLPFDPEFFEETIITDVTGFDGEVSFGEESENSAVDFVSSGDSVVQDVDGTNPHAETVDRPSSPESAPRLSPPEKNNQRSKNSNLPKSNKKHPKLKCDWTR